MTMRSRALVVVAVAVVLLAGLYAALRPSGSGEAAPEARERHYRLAIVGGRLAEGPASLEAVQGDSITLVVSAEKGGEVHIHGYRQEVSLKPGAEATIAFRADRAGRYPIEYHDPGGGEAELAAIAVQPRP